MSEIKIGERLARLEEAMENSKTSQTEIKDMLRQFGEALKGHENKDQERFESLLAHMETHYVLKNEYTPIKNLIQGFVGLSLTGVVYALLNLILK